MGINIGDIVARKSYKKDIIFVVDRLLNYNMMEIAILKGLTIRITADAPTSDLDLVNKDNIESCVKSLEKKIKDRIRRFELENSKRKFENKEIIYTGKILHLDGDRRYSDKSVKYYRQLRA